LVNANRNAVNETSSQITANEPAFSRNRGTTVRQAANRSEKDQPQIDADDPDSNTVSRNDAVLNLLITDY
jgi:hypothetical protein